MGGWEAHVEEEQHIHACLRVNQEDSRESKGWKEEGRCMFKGWSQGLMKLVSQEVKGLQIGCMCSKITTHQTCFRDWWVMRRVNKGN